MRRPKLKPDTRPRWNDPDLKTHYRGKEYTAEEWQEMCARSLDSQTHYKNDPTYNLKKKK